MEGTSAELERELGDTWIVVQARSLSNVLQTMKRRIISLVHGKKHSKEDVKQYKDMLHDIKGRWTKDGVFAHEVQHVDPELQARSAGLFKECEEAVTQLEVSPEEAMPQEVQAIYEKLLEVKGRALDMQKAGSKISLDAVQELQEELDAVDRQRLASDGIFGGTLGHVPPGQAACSEVLNQCYELVAELLSRATEPPPAMREVLSNLAGIKAALVRMKVAGPHTPEDVAHYQQRLDGMDSRRRDGIFCGDLASGTIPPGQAQASALLSRCYELVQDLLGSAQEMPADMHHIYKRLAKAYSELTAIRNRPSHSTSDVKPIQWNLDEIDSGRRDGVFTGDLTNVPPGQAICSNLLNDCYRLVYLLYSSASDVEGGAPEARGPGHLEGPASVTASA